nr:unnamed protein product [Callosobruchus analis]
MKSNTFSRAPDNDTKWPPFLDVTILCAARKAQRELRYQKKASFIFHTLPILQILPCPISSVFRDRTS